MPILIYVYATCFDVKDVNFADMSVETVPAPGLGPLMLLILNIIENVTLDGKVAWNSTDLYHYTVEVGWLLVYFVSYISSSIKNQDWILLELLCNILFNQIYFFNVVKWFLMHNKSYYNFLFRQAMKLAYAHQSLLGDPNVEFDVVNITTTIIRFGFIHEP